MNAISFNSVLTSIYCLNVTKNTLEYQISHLKNMPPSQPGVQSSIELLEQQLFDIIEAINEFEGIYNLLSDETEERLPEQTTFYSLESMKDGLNKTKNMVQGTTKPKMNGIGD